jgi:hypothetical protein
MRINIEEVAPPPRREITDSAVQSGVYIVQEEGFDTLRIAIKCGNRVTFLNTSAGPTYDTISGLQSSNRNYFIVKEVEEVTVR